MRWRYRDIDFITMSFTIVCIQMFSYDLAQSYSFLHVYDYIVRFLKKNISNVSLCLPTFLRPLSPLTIIIPVFARLFIPVFIRLFNTSSRVSSSRRRASIQYVFAGPFITFLRVPLSTNCRLRSSFPGGRAPNSTRASS